MIYQPSPARISSHVFDLIPEIVPIANAMLVETGLPHLSRKLLPDRERETALDTLHAPLHGLPLSRRQHDMQMFRHNGKGVQQEPSLFSISEYGFHQEFRVRGSYKEGSPLKGHGGDGVGIDGAPRIWVQRSIPQGHADVRVKTLTYPNPIQVWKARSGRSCPVDQGLRVGQGFSPDINPNQSGGL